MPRLRDALRQAPVLEGPFAAFCAERAIEDPYALFVNWFNEAVAAAEPEPHAMILSTIGLDGMPDSRVLILKEVDSSGFQFASSCRSAKGRQIAARPSACLTFYWKSLGRQVRIRGEVHDLGRAVSARDFAQRSTGSKAIALVGKQSSKLCGREALSEAIGTQLDRLRREPELGSPDWTAYALQPTAIEFWQAHSTRAHIRLRYSRSTETTRWESEMLWP